ncbi:MAG: prepilin-type N-terminal cleavage/methylation domain-containing protein [Actinobacteria bacterium]|nr:prepilin-type N-terminal cleavage/methylation domain-containing protein [Actinomycetota bacterium]
MLSKLSKRMKGEGGFTLIELLVVIIIIAILAAIAIPTFLGQRQKAQDAAAKSLVRNGMTAVESAFTDTRAFDLIVSPMLEDIEPSIVFVYAGAGGGVAAGPTAQASGNAVDFSGMDGANYEVGTVSQSGRTFGVHVNKSADATTFAPGNTFYIGANPQTW